jgi:hypothetical protein
VKPVEMVSDSSERKDIADLYTPFREAVSALAADDALYTVWAYSQRLQLTAFQFPRDIEVARSFLENDVPQSSISEWELLLVAKEAIINSGNTGLSLKRWAVLASTLNALKNMENGIYRRFGSPSNVLIEMIRIAHRQFIWQVDFPTNSSIARYLVIFDTPEIDQISQERSGLPVRAVFQYGLMLYGGFMESAVVRVPAEIPGVDPNIFARFLAFAARSAPELNAFLSAEQNLSGSYAYAYNSLYAYPLISTKHDQETLLRCPLPTLLFWRMTKGLYYALVDDPRFGAALGVSFQRYVGESIVRAARPAKNNLLSEVRYGPRAIARDSVDWILLGTDCALFIECKAKRLSWTAKQSLDDPKPLEGDIGYLAAAVVQTYKNFVDYRDNKYPHLPFDPRRDVFLLIVTLENWFILGPKMRELLKISVLKQIVEAGLSPNLLDQAPYSVIPIAELECGMEVSREVGLQEFWWGKITHPKMSEWDWRTFILTVYPGFDFANLFEKELDALSPESETDET